MTPIDMLSSQAESISSHQRSIDFAEVYLLSGNKMLHYLYYLRQFQNLFDLEFFANKLPSLSFSIAGLEQCVLSGAPFWEDGNDADDLSSDEYLDNEQPNQPMYAD